MQVSKKVPVILYFSMVKRHW